MFDMWAEDAHTQVQGGCGVATGTSPADAAARGAAAATNEDECFAYAYAGTGAICEITADGVCTSAALVHTPSAVISQMAPVPAYAYAKQS